MKKRISLVICFILLLTIFPIKGLAAEGISNLKIDVLSSGVVAVDGKTDESANGKNLIVKVYQGTLLVYLDQIKVTNGEISFSFVPRVKKEDALYTVKIEGTINHSSNFTYDTGEHSNNDDNQAPIITVSGIKNNSIYYDAVQPVISVRDNYSPPEKITIIAKLDGNPFESGTKISTKGEYTLTVTATDEAGNTKTATYKFTISSQSGGETGGGDPTPNPPKEDGQTSPDKALEKSLASTGKAILSLGNNNSAQITPNIIQGLANQNKPLTVKNTGVTLNFAPQSLITPELTQALENNKSKLELGVRALTEEEKEEIFKNDPSEKSTGISEIGGKIFDFTAQIITKNSNGTTTIDKIDSFNEPVAITIDLSDLDLTKEGIAKLTGIRYEVDKKGNIVQEKLSGTYHCDEETGRKTFTFYTDKFGLYGVVKADNLIKINLTIDSLKSLVNGRTVTNDVAPIIMNDRTMVPVRFVAENLGTEVEWIKDTKTVVIKLDEKTLTMVIDTPIEGFDTPPTIVNNRTMVPLRYVSEKLGANVMWFPKTRSIQIVK